MKKDENDPWWSTFEDLKAEKQVASMLSKEDPAKRDFSEEYLDRLHDQIMAKVERREILRPARFVWMKSKKFILKSSLSLMALLVVIALPQHQLSSQQNIAHADGFSEQFIEAAKSNPDQFSEMLVNYQSQSDFFGDVALESFHYDLSHEGEFIQSFIGSNKL